jgi:alkanesulfonate monooxygenase SsuD/methylene tetrahydromethanopterin reductase-like flavin-dependent oxidoreductase (luciferase family)
VVADHDREAIAAARQALRRWFDSFNHLWLAERGEEYYPSDLDAFFECGFVLAGSPATVRGQVERLLEELGGNYFVGVFAFGDLAPERVLRSLDLFGREVIPPLLAGAGRAS